MRDKIGEEFRFLGLIKFAGPTIVMMVFMSLYTMIDGIFVSRFVGTGALSAVNIVYPMYNIVIGIGIMLATGGSAVIAKKMGEDKVRQARENFTLLTLVGLITGFAILVFGMIFIEPMIKMLGADTGNYDYCYKYASGLLFFTPLAMLQLLFQYFFVTAGKPGMGLTLTIAGGCANIVFDYLFIAVFNMGIIGAAIATGIGISIPGIAGLIYFTVKRNGSLYFVRPKMDAKAITHSCTNGMSEMVSNVATAVVTFMYNNIMLRYLGEDGVAAITIVLYAQFLLNALFLGFSMGVAPVISYNYGSNNAKQLKRTFRYCVSFVSICSVIACIVATVFAPYIVEIFTSKESAVYEIAINGFILFNINFLFAGINIFTSSMFTAFSNGRVSAIISFMRTFVFITGGLIFLPMVFGINGVWVAISVAEGLTLVMCVIYMCIYKNKYNYA